MQPQISPETEAAILELVGRISVARSHDAAIRAELAGHLREKILGYLSGEEPITQADAVVLARAHFGNPAAVARALRRAHRPYGFRLGFVAELQATILAYAWAMSLAYVVATLIYIPMLILPGQLRWIQSRAEMTEWPLYPLEVLMFLTGPLLFWASARSGFIRSLWKRTQKRSWSVWFAAALSLNVLAILVFAQLFGARSDIQYGPGLALGCLAYDAICGPSDLPGLFGGTLVTLIVAGMFWKRVAGPRPSLREFAACLGAWLVTSFALRAVIMVGVFCVRRHYGFIVMDNSPLKCLLLLVIRFLLQPFAAALIAIVTAAILHRRRGETPEIQSA